MKFKFTKMGIQHLLLKKDICFELKFYQPPYVLLTGPSKNMCAMRFDAIGNLDACLTKKFSDFFKCACTFHLNIFLISVKFLSLKSTGSSDIPDSSKSKIYGWLLRSTIRLSNCVYRRKEMGFGKRREEKIFYFPRCSKFKLEKPKYIQIC